MPFEAAKAVAATFCYHIRYALTPLFGLDFISLCIKPGEEGFEHMVIDRNIVRRCTEEATGYRSISREGSQGQTPITPVSASGAIKWETRSLRPRAAGLFDPESGYYSDTDRSDRYVASPQTSFTWTAMNTPRSIAHEVKVPSSAPLMAGNAAGDGCGAPPNSPDSSSSIESRDRQLTCRIVDGDDSEDTSPRSAKVNMVSEKRRRPAISTTDTRAAYALMQLHFADASLKDGSKKRRASS